MQSESNILLCSTHCIHRAMLNILHPQCITHDLLYIQCQTQSVEVLDRRTALDFHVQRPEFASHLIP